MAKRKATPIEGRWNIVSLTAWDVEETVEELQLIIRFERSDAGQFQFGCVYGEMDCRLTERDGKPAAEFSWEGHDEDEQVFGRGWAVVDGDELGRMIFFHMSDESEFRAKHVEEKSKRNRK